MGQPIPNIPNVQVNNVGIYEIPYWQIRQPYVPNFNPVTNQLGFPIVDMPGCVNMHKDNRRDGKPWDRDLVNQDPKGSTTLCPHGQYPSYNAMDYEPEQMTIITEQEAPPVASSPPPEPPGSPETPDTKDTAPKDPPCPGPNAQRIGDIAQNQKEKVSGFELQPDPVNPGRKICITLYEDIGAVEQFLPTPQVASTTAVIATVATGSALLAKPLADLMLRVFRPAIKKAIGTVQKILGKEQKTRLSLRERMELQRDRTRAIRELKRMTNSLKK
jgi:hypothetical protein